MHQFYDQKKKVFKHHLKECYVTQTLTWLSLMSIRVFLAWPIFLMSSSPVPGVINPGVIPPGYGVFSPPG